MNPLHIGFDAVNRRINLSPDDRKTHTHIIGSSGSGKSKFMEWMMRGDLRNGQGFCLLDPHGTLYDAVVDYCAHTVPRQDVILLNLSEPDSIVGFNPFQRSGSGDVSVQVDRRITATMHAWDIPNTDQTPTLARTLRLIYTIMLEMNLGLPQVAHLIDFNARKIRSHLVERLPSSLVQKEWRELQELRAKDWRDETLSARNRLFKFLTSPTLGRFMGVQGRSLNLQEVMDQGKVLLVNLAPSDYLSHENARVFGALMVNEFFECALRRKKDRFGNDPTPYYLYMDEFQNFISLDIAEMLDQVRKFGLFQVLAHQRFGHLDENLIDAVLTNCKVKAVFGGLPTASAKLMAEELFIGELDPMKIKVAIEQTKFWPEYSRDKAYTHTVTRGESFATSTSYMSADSSMTSTGEMFSATDWFAGPIQVGHSSGSASGSTQASSTSEAHVDHHSESDGVSDIPIFKPVPFRELSSVQFYSIEEQLVELTAALKEQYGRHCFIKIQHQPTQPMLVPFVEAHYTSERNKNWYLQKQLAKADGLPAAQVDQLIDAQENALVKAAEAQPVIEVSNRSTPKDKKPKRRGSARKSIFATIEEPPKTSDP